MTQTNDLILITGATGNIGTLVCQNLVKAGLKVRAAYNSPHSKAKALSLGVTEAVHLDITDPASLDAAFSGVTKAFILVPMHPNMLELGYNMIAAAKRANVQHVVRISGMGVSPDSPILLGQWHGKTDVRLIDSGIGYTIVRPNSFMQNFIAYGGEVIKTQNAIYLPLGDCKVSWVDVRDVAAAASKLLSDSDHIDEIYTLTGSEALSTDSIAAIFTKQLGRSITYHDVPETVATKALLDGGMDATMAQALAELHATFTAGYGGDIPSDLEKILGRSPISFDQFVADHKNSLSNLIKN